MVSSQIYPFSLDVESVPLGPCPSGLGRPGGGGGVKRGIWKQLRRSWPLSQQGPEILGMATQLIANASMESRSAGSGHLALYA